MLKIRAQIFFLATLLLWHSLVGQNPDTRLYAGLADDNVLKAYYLCTQEDFAKIDERVITAFPDDFSSIREFTLQLTSVYSDDKSKARSIYTWIALNIDYDNEAVPGNGMNDQKAINVWREKRAVCEGYANLFAMMCRLAGLESRVIIGYVRERDGQPLQYPNHAWNSVMIDGKWYLLDVTWASLQWRGDRSRTANVTEVMNMFFLTDPREMIYTHLPEDPYWQLQNSFVSLEQFENGGEVIRKTMSSKPEKEINFEHLIASYESLDSLDRSIALLERQEENKWNKAREYNLGIAYFYKAQKILHEARCLSINEKERAKKLAKEYYKKSLNQLALIDEKDRVYEFSKALSSNVTFRIETLQ